jgi:transposase
VAQLDPGEGKTKRAYLWVYRNNGLGAGPPIVVYDYRESRSGEQAAAFLGPWRGCLMVDDYAGYKALFKTGITELACWAHARRKFYDLHVANGSPIAKAALERIGQLYEIERHGRDLGSLEREALRRREARPVLDALFEWLWQTRKTVAEGKRHGEGAGLQPEALGGADPLCRVGGCADR